jgi:hypothetical protein
MKGGLIARLFYCLKKGQPGTQLLVMTPFTGSLLRANKQNEPSSSILHGLFKL